MLNVKAASVAGFSSGISKMSNKAKALNNLDKNILSINKTNVQASLGTSNGSQASATIRTGESVPSLAKDGSPIVGINIDTTA